MQPSPAGVQIVDAENNSGELLVLPRPAQQGGQGKKIQRGWTSKRQTAQDIIFSKRAGELHLKGIIRLVPSGEARQKIDGPKNTARKAAEQETYHEYGAVYASPGGFSKGSWIWLCLVCL